MTTKEDNFKKAWNAQTTDELCEEERTGQEDTIETPATPPKRCGSCGASVATELAAGEGLPCGH